MELTKHGFDKKIAGWRHLEDIYEILDLKYKYEIWTVKGWDYFICDEDLSKDEAIQWHQQFLHKSFYLYKNYGENYCCHEIWTFQKLHKVIEEEQKKKEAAEKARLEKEKEKEKKLKSKENKGIYGIYFNDKLIYIGKTMNSFQERFNTHKREMNSDNPSQYVSKYLKKHKKENDEVILKPLLTLQDFKVQGELSNRDIEAMELALITLYQPICNVQGKMQDYKFSKNK